MALTASGGSGTGYTWSGTGLPPGLSISPAGMISGMPGYTSAGTYQVTIMVQDLANHSQTATLPLTIRTPPRCTSPFPPQSAQVGVPYGPHPIHVSGGSPPYSFVVTGGFPNGVALSSGGVLSGTPSPGAEGDYSLAFRLGDSLGFTSTCAVGITVTADPAPLTIAAPSVLPSGMEQVSYGPMIFSASGGTGTRVWSAAGLPQGVTMSATGALGGTPAKGASGAYSVAVTVRDGLNRSAAVTLPLVINSGSLLVSPPALPPGLVGTAYGPVTLSATGGTAPYTFTAGSGLPNGLTLSPAGTLSGAPAAGSEGSYTLTVTVRDAAGASGAASWILPVQTSALAIAGMTGLPPGRERVAYPQVRFSATGGSGGYTWAASGLPAGLSVSPDGVLGGTPARDSYGTYTVEITVRDTSLKSDSVTLPLAVYTNPRLAFAPPLPPAQVGVPYRFTLTAAAGVAPYTWTSSAGPPPGLVLSTDGLLSGAPTTAGSFEVGLTVTDAHGYGMSTSVAMTITAGAARLAIHTPVSFPNGIETVNHPGVYFTASGGTGGYVWSAAGLPSGLAIYSTTAGDGLGVVNGTPAAGTRGSYTVEVTVTDAGGATASITLPLLIQSGQELLIASPQSLGPYTESGGNADVVFTAHGGTPPYTWSAMGLPPGMTFTPGGILRGKPAAGSRGAYPARFTVQDSRQETASVTISIVVSGTVQITGPDTLPAAAAGTSYGPLTFTAGGGSAPYTWSATGALPQGLAFSPNGVLSGVPAAGSAGSYPVTIRVADFMGSTAQVQLALLVEASPSSLAVAGPRSLPAAQELLAFGPVTLTASGGSGGYVWGGSGLPAGLTLSPGGVLGGAPAAGTRGTHTVHVTVRDSSGNVASSTMSLVVETPALTVSHSVLPAGATGAPYGPLTLTATGGQPPYAWTVLDGLPNGMALSPHGVLSGAPAPGAAGNYTLSIQVSDGRGIATATRLTLTIAAPPPAPISITCSLPGPEETGKPYASTCVVVGGTPRYHWSLTGSLPAGLTFDPLSGSVTGIPLVSGAYQYTIKVTDSSQPALVASESFGGAVRPLSFTVSPASFLFVSRAGAPAPAQRLSIGPGGFSYTVAVPAEACGWLRVSPDSGEAPALLDVGIDAAGLGAGTHHCTISVIVNGVPQDVSVTATVAGPSLTLSPPFAVFTSQAGGAAPAPQTIAVSATDGAAVDFSAASACPWLTVTQAGSSTPAALVLSAEPDGLVDSNYRCPVILTASETTAPRLTATLQIHSDRLRVSPQTVVLNAAQGSTVPVVAALQLTGPERPVSFATTIDSDGGGNWLSAEVTSSATTPTTIRLQASPLGLAAGSYAAVVHMASPAGEIAVPVKFTITPVTVRAAPSRLAFRGPQGGSWPAQVISVTGDDGAPAAFTLEASSRLRVSPGPGAGNFSVSVASGLGPGVYADNAVTVLPSLSGAPPQVVPAIITVEAPPAPLLRVSADALTLAAVQGGPAATQLLLATHQGASWTPQVTAGSGGGAWLTASIPAGVAPAGAPVPIRVSADPSKVPANSGGSQAGVYAGEVVVADAAGQEMRVDVTLVVSPAATLSLSRHGLSFSAVKGGTGSPDEMIDLFNPGLRALAWSASATTLAGGDWLKLAHASGVCPAGFAGHMTVQVDPAAVAVLTPGWYYGSVEVRARDAETGEDAVNSPQSVSVALQVLPEATQFSPRARPGALLFSAAAGSANVPARVVTIHSASPRTMRYTAAVATDGGDGWCQVSPAFGSFYGSTAVSVNADFSQLTAGLHDCVINLAFSDGASQAVHVTAAAGSTSSPPKARMAAQEGGAGCTAPGLVVSQREPFSGAALAAFQPAGLEVEVRDACGNAVDDAGVIVSFSTPEPAAVLKPVGDGLYRGSWAPVPEWRNLPGVEVMMEAAAQRGAGETAAAGRARAVSAAVRLGAPHPPHIARDGVVNSTSLTPGAWVAPCTWITIFGENFARGEALADAAPLPLELQDVRVFLGGRPIPMAYAAEGQINAQIPCDIQANSEQSIWIVSGATRSLPVNIVVASAQPSILPADRRGSGPADAFRIQTDGQHVTVDAANPAGEGDLIGIYCTGLGPVAPAVPAGARSPGEPLPTVLLPVSATIGGKPAKVEWAGLMPGGIGVYQVNVRVPPGVEKDDAAPLAIVVDGYSSQPGITIAVR